MREARFERGKTCRFHACLFALLLTLLQLERRIPKGCTRQCLPRPDGRCCRQVEFEDGCLVWLELFPLFGGEEVLSTKDEARRICGIGGKKS